MEKRRLEDLKKMTLEELRAISRPLEVGEIIQEGDWGLFKSDFNAHVFLDSLAGARYKSHWVTIWYRPTDRPTDEIKLGWYRNKKVPNEIARFGLLDPDDDDNCLGYWHGTLEPDWFYVPGWEFIGEELPEPGEWVDPGDVKSSELPIRARFRDVNNDKWEQGELTGFSTKGPCFEMNNCPWMYQCQVWRPSK